MARRSLMADVVRALDAHGVVMLSPALHQAFTDAERCGLIDADGVTADGRAFVASVDAAREACRVRRAAALAN